MTAGLPARIYGLAPAKGTIAIGADADLVLWNPDRRVTLSDDDLHGKTGYTPYAGRTLRGWPQVVIRRGEVIARDDALCAASLDSRRRSAGVQANRGVRAPGTFVSL